MDPATIASLAAMLGSQIIGGAMQSSSQEDVLNAQIAAQQRAEARIDAAYNELSPYYKSIVDALPPEQQLQALQEWAPTQMSEYDPASAQKFLDPSIAYQQEQASKAIQASQAARNGLNSGGALKELADRAQNIGQLGWQNAQQASYQDYLNHFNAARDANNAVFNQQKDLLNASTNAQNSLANLKLGQVNSNNSIDYAMGANQGALNGLWKNTVGQGLQQLGSPENIGAIYQMLKGDNSSSSLKSLGQTIGQGATQQSGQQIPFNYGYPPQSIPTNSGYGTAGA